MDGCGDRGKRGGQLGTKRDAKRDFFIFSSSSAFWVSVFGTFLFLFLATQRPEVRNNPPPPPMVNQHPRYVYTETDYSDMPIGRGLCLAFRGDVALLPLGYL